ncbi:MAG: AfsR/SARP family transcriptional regulator, partial [Acidimicrobiia bacterium]
MFRIYLTGRVTFEGSVVVDESALPGPLGRSLAAMLALSRGPVSRSRLADILWDGNPPRAYDRSINPLLSKLRAASEGAGGPRDLFMSGSGTVELRRSPQVWIDLEHATIALDAAEGILRSGFP